MTGVGSSNRCAEEIIIIQPFAVSVMRHWPDVWRGMDIHLWIIGMTLQLHRERGLP